jgi:2-C-methyl-D-erythritol 4-phosphate cytidylyltransferase
MKGIPVRLVRGEVYNIKITFPSDLRMAEKLLGSEESGHAE